MITEVTQDHCPFGDDHTSLSFESGTRNATKNEDSLSNAAAFQIGLASKKERAAIVETNTEVGHWEGDTVIGANHQGLLLTLVERVAKYTIIVKLPSKHAHYLATRLIASLLRCLLPVRSITFDNGREFTDHQRISGDLKAPVYFARPYHSWERGLNENTNGLIRQYIPKHCRISIVKSTDVSWIQDQLNNRPRKTLGFLTLIQYAQKQGIALQT